MFEVVGTKVFKQFSSAASGAIHGKDTPEIIRTWFGAAHVQIFSKITLPQLEGFMNVGVLSA